MRFEARFSNGYWKLFDTQDYCSALYGPRSIALFGLEVDAKAAADNCNTYHS